MFHWFYVAENLFSQRNILGVVLTRILCYSSCFRLNYELLKKYNWATLWKLEQRSIRVVRFNQDCCGVQIWNKTASVLWFSTISVFSLFCFLQQILKAKVQVKRKMNPYSAYCKGLIAAVSPAVVWPLFFLFMLKLCQLTQNMYSIFN